MAPRAISAVLFYPRGGSAHAARALTRGLRAVGWDVTLVAGSRRDLGAHGDAKTFYGPDVHAVDFDQALATKTPLRFEGPPGTAPLHPSFEDRPGAPDEVFARLDDAGYELQVRAWSRELREAMAPRADVLHIHHLTPINEAAARVAPHVPVVGQLHGTELLMLEQIARGAPEAWEHAEQWRARMNDWARRCSRLMVAPAGLARALGLLDVDPKRVLTLPGGVDVELFSPRKIDRLDFWRRVLVEHPQGWLPGQVPGSIRYTDEDAAAAAEGTVILYVGRFTAVKRLDRLITAFGRAQAVAKAPASLILVGGHPGECEGEHPVELASRLGIERVFLAGWYSHDDLPDFFAASDVVASASEREQFGQTLVEGMACGLPALATRSLGPEGIIDDGETGWLVQPDDDRALASALEHVIADPGERARRGRAARTAVCERFSWPGIAGQLGAVLEEVVVEARGASPETPAQHRPPEAARRAGNA